MIIIPEFLHITCQYKIYSQLNEVKISDDSKNQKIVKYKIKWRLYIINIRMKK